MNIAVLDIGATAIKTGMIENINEEKHLPILTQKKETPSNAHLGGHCLMETVREIISGYSGYSRIGISTAGQVDSEQGIIRYANENIPGYTGMKIREILQNTFNVAVAVENDVNAAALGEIIFGIGKKIKDKNLLCLTFGTGIGGAIVIDGKIFKGSVFSAGEFGSIITHGGSLPDVKSGYYEKYASTSALVRNVQAVKPELDDGRKIFNNLEDMVVRKIIDDWICEILYGLAGLIHIFNPSYIILGGGIMKESYLINSLREKIHDYIMPSFGNVILLQASLGNDAGLWGAGYLASNSKFDNENTEMYA